MNDRRDYFRTLLACYCNNTISREEAEELFDYLQEHPGIAESLLDEEDYLRFMDKANAVAEPEGLDSIRLYGRILSQVRGGADGGKPQRQRRRASLFRTARWRAAAAVLLLAAGGLYYLLISQRDVTPLTVNTPESMADVQPPGLSRAYITLSDGEKIALDEASDGALADDGQAQLIKTPEGEVVYRPFQSDNAGRQVYNTMWNPRGSRVIQMRLSDGSRVWLNAGSSITYPVVFTGAERKVSVEGEAYFEVAHEHAKPFVVSNGTTSIIVLGTHFNVSAYADEEEQKITLLEGKVQVDIPGATSTLKPGQQARIRQELHVKNEVSIDDVMAWKNGYFSFNDSDIYTIMKKVARWYDIEVVYEGSFRSETFIGNMSMDTRLSELLEVLALNNVGYTIENKTVKIKPVK